MSEIAKNWRSLEPRICNFCQIFLHRLTKCIILKSILVNNLILASIRNALVNMQDQDSVTILSLLPAVVHSPFAAQQKKIVEQRNQIESTRGSQEISGFVNCSSFTCSGNESFFFSRIYSIESISSRGTVRQFQKFTTFKKSCSISPLQLRKQQKMESG